MNISPKPVIKPQPNNLSDPFWHPRTLEEIAKAQGVQPITNADVLIGGWPEDELNDNFEETLKRWRSENISD